MFGFSSKRTSDLPSAANLFLLCACQYGQISFFSFSVFHFILVYVDFLQHIGTEHSIVSQGRKEGWKRKYLMIMLLFSKISTFQNTLMWRTLSAKKRALAREFQAVFAAYEFRSLLERTQVKYGKMSGLVGIFLSEVSLELFSPCLHQHISRRLPVSELL